jgi:hypothetical protein
VVHDGLPFLDLARSAVSNRSCDAVSNHLSEKPRNMFLATK